jgi:uncharacterized membrane protein YidH (DUF202 family)
MLVFLLCIDAVIEYVIIGLRTATVRNQHCPMSSQPELGPEFSISSQHGSPKSRSRSPVKHDSLTNPDDDAVNQPSGSSSKPQPTTGSPSAPSSSQKTGNVATGSTALPFSLSLTLKNTGSVARDHLASERTFLAYVRTSLSFASAGVGTSVTTLGAVTFKFVTHLALVQLFRVSVSTSANGSLSGASAARYARPLGATLIALGISVLGLGEQVFPCCSGLWSPA